MILSGRCDCLKSSSSLPPPLSSYLPFLSRRSDWNFSVTLYVVTHSHPFSPVRPLVVRVSYPKSLPELRSWLVDVGGQGFYLWITQERQTLCDTLLHTPFFYKLFLLSTNTERSFVVWGTISEMGTQGWGLQTSLCLCFVWLLMSWPISSSQRHTLSITIFWGSCLYEEFDPLYSFWVVSSSVLTVLTLSTP